MVSNHLPARVHARVYECVFQGAACRVHTLFRFACVCVCVLMCVCVQVSFRNRVLILFDWLKARVFGRDTSLF